MRFARLGMIIDRGARKLFPTSAARPVHAGGGRRAPRPPRVEPGNFFTEPDQANPHGIPRPQQKEARS